jgi:hypothetical protein
MTALYSIVPTISSQLLCPPIRRKRNIVGGHKTAATVGRPISSSDNFLHTIFANAFLR